MIVIAGLVMLVAAVIAGAPARPGQGQPQASRRERAGSPLRAVRVGPDGIARITKPPARARSAPPQAAGTHPQSRNGQSAADRPCRCTRPRQMTHEKRVSRP